MAQWKYWRQHFEAHRARALPSGLEQVGAVPTHWRAPLADSLARFQLGESGEGRIAHEIDRVRLPGIDEDYRSALKLFVAEEGRHARLLGQMVLALGGELLARSWTERLFVHGRRLLGVRLKLMVLLVAEVVGIAFYGLLASRLPPGPLRLALEEIMADEEHHLRFHGQFFSCQPWGPLARALWRVAWWALASLAAAVVLLEHRRTLRAMHIPLAEAVQVFSVLIAQAERATAPLQQGERLSHAVGAPRA